MALTNVSFELNDKTKEQMDEICEDLGMTADEAFQIFAHKVVNEQGIPFEVTEKDYPPEDGCCILRKAAVIIAGLAAAISAAAVIIHIVRWLHKKD